MRAHSQGGNLKDLLAWIPCSANEDLPRLLAIYEALVADGASIVRDVKHIDRGYDGFVANLRSLGAVIEEGRDTDAPTAS